MLVTNNEEDYYVVEITCTEEEYEEAEAALLDNDLKRQNFAGSLYWTKFNAEEHSLEDWEKYPKVVMTLEEYIEYWRPFVEYYYDTSRGLDVKMPEPIRDLATEAVSPFTRAALIDQNYRVYDVTDLTYGSADNATVISVVREHLETVGWMKHSPLDDCDVRQYWNDRIVEDVREIRTKYYEANISVLDNAERLKKLVESCDYFAHVDDTCCDVLFFK